MELSGLEHRTGGTPPVPASIPRHGKGFFSQSQLSVQTLLRRVRTLPCAIACIYICAHVKDPVVHVRVRWIMETLKHPACTTGWVPQLCGLSLGERQPRFPMEEIQLGQHSCKKKKICMWPSVSACVGTLASWFKETGAIRPLG